MTAISKFASLMFASLLMKDFKTWKAYEVGLIDDKGNLLKDPTTQEEKRALGSLEDLVRKIKKIMLKIMPSNKYLQFLITAYLLKKESIEFKDYSDALFELSDDLTSNEIDMLNEYLLDLNRKDYFNADT